MKKLKKITPFFGFLIISFIIIGYLVFAWTEPSLVPPDGNVPAPLNTSINAQAKEGALVVGNNSSVTTGLIVRYGNVGIGTTSPTSPLHVVYSGNTYINFQNTSAGTFGGLVLYNGSTPVYFATNGAMLSFFVGDGSQQDMVITNVGNVGIGTTAPATRLEVQGGALCVRSGTGVSCNTTSGSVSAQYFYYISDLRLKTNIQPIENALSRLLTLEGISYQTKYENNRSLGLIAQDVEKVFPEVVNTDKETGLKWIDYGKLVPALIEAIKEQQKEIESLKIQLELLQTK